MSSHYNRGLTKVSKFRDLKDSWGFPVSPPAKCKRIRKSNLGLKRNQQ